MKDGKLIVILSITTVLVFGLVYFFFIHGKKDEMPVLEEGYQVADFIFAYDHDGHVSMYDGSGNLLDEAHLKERLSTDHSKTEIDELKFLYYEDMEKNILYAYDSLDHYVYKITVSISEVLTVEPWFVSASLEGVESFKVEDRFVFLLDSSRDMLHFYDSENQTHEKIELLGKATDYLYVNDVLFYAYDTHLVKTNLSHENDESIELGDQTKELFATDGLIFAINDFGRHTDNALLFKIDQETLAVYGFAELESDTISFSYDKQMNTAYIGKLSDSGSDYRLIDLEKMAYRDGTIQLKSEAKALSDQLFYYFDESDLHVASAINGSTYFNFEASGDSIFLIVLESKQEQ